MREQSVSNRTLCATMLGAFSFHRKRSPVWLRLHKRDTLKGVNAGGEQRAVFVLYYKVLYSNYEIYLIYIDNFAGGIIYDVGFFLRRASLFDGFAGFA